MSRKRDVLQQLKRDELLAAAAQYGLWVPDRRVRDDLIDALAASRKAGLADILEGLSRSRLKEVCRVLDLDDSGREKAAIIARLTGSEVHPVASPRTTTENSSLRVEPKLPKPQRSQPPVLRESEARPPAVRPQGAHTRKPSRGSEE